MFFLRVQSKTLVCIFLCGVRLTSIAEIISIGNRSIYISIPSQRHHHLNLYYSNQTNNYFSQVCFCSVLGFFTLCAFRMSCNVPQLGNCSTWNVQIPFSFFLYTHNSTHQFSNIFSDSRNQSYFLK